MSTPRPKGRYVKPAPSTFDELYPGHDLFPDTRVDPDLDKDKRYTTPETMALCMKLARVDAWDLDVAADAESHWAEKYYDVQANGLAHPWFGRVWCNPPFSNIEPWVRQAWASMSLWNSGRPSVVAMLLPANRTEQPWFQNYVEPWRDGRTPEPFEVHFLPSRVRYGHPGNPKGIRAGSPPFASMLLVWRSQ